VPYPRDAVFDPDQILGDYRGAQPQAHYTGTYIWRIARRYTHTYGGRMSRLSRDRWIDAGFRALTEKGPQALKAEPLARGLNTTKGSFYWHFKDVPAFQAEMLACWEKQATQDIIEARADHRYPAT